MKITMIGHSTVLIETAGRRILTDPFFSLSGNLAYIRRQPPALDRSSVPDVDLVLVSHNHFDHTDRKYFQALPSTVPVLAPSAVRWVTKLKGARHVTGIKTWERRTFGPISITAVPAWHSAITRGYIIESGEKRVYFAGDTYFVAGFMERIAIEFRPNLVLMPVTTFRLPVTMGERGALAATRLLRPEVVIPIHLGITTRSPFLRGSETPEHFIERVQQAGLATRVFHLREGDSWSGFNEQSPAAVELPNSLAASIGRV